MEEAVHEHSTMQKAEMRDYTEGLRRAGLTIRTWVRSLCSPCAQVLWLFSLLVCARAAF